MAIGEKIIPVNIEEEMKSAYIDYSMSVIVSRALPDVRDGLKPVQRRVLFGMHELGLSHNKSHKKSARIVGEVLGKYHPHGDLSVYDTMVRMAQDWSLRYPLVDGQGNFGSVDGDSPAAMRYTEARLAKIAEEMLVDIDKETVDFELNFDDTLQEPVVLPAKIPNLLLNGGSGIAVGMATNMLPHNLNEVVDGIKAYIDNNDITIEELIEHIKAPDFPTAGIIYGTEEIQKAYETGKGKIVVRAEAEIEEGKQGKDRIVVTEIPYQVNKAQLIMKTADMVNNEKIEGITDIRDESDRKGLRIVYELKRDAISKVVLNQLFKYTQLETSFGMNNVTLVKGRPMQLNLKALIKYYVEHRHEVLVRKIKYQLRKAEERAHILEGLLVALDHLDEVIKLIRGSKNPDEAKKGLMKKFELSEVQAKAILDMRLQKLTGLERDKIKDEYKELQEQIKYYNKVLDDKALRMDILKKELDEIKETYGDERRTRIQHKAEEISVEDMIPEEDVVITVSHHGYIKRTSLDSYRRQRRGGRGARGGGVRSEDFIEYLFIASTHNYILFFTQEGQCYWLKVHEIPEGTKTSKGRAIQNLMQIPKDDKIRAFITVDNLKEEDYLQNHFVVFCTKKGVVKKTPLEAFSNPRSSGIRAIKIKEGDELLEAKMTDGKAEIVIGVRSGRAIRFDEDAVRPMGRTAAGVRGIKLSGEDDEVVGMVSVFNKDEDIGVLVVSEKGYGKRSSLGDYRKTNRGGKGVITMDVTKKTGPVISLKGVEEDHEIMIINKSGIIIRMGLKNVRVMGRNTQGVRLIKLDKDDEIAAVAKIEIEDEEKGQEKKKKSKKKKKKKKGKKKSKGKGGKKGKKGKGGSNKSSKDGGSPELFD